MRLLDVTFAPFGALRDLRLDLAGPKDALHVVFGPNEAGKSTALRGIIGFFFQIDHQSRDQHRTGVELRVGATLEIPEGGTLRLVRRKGRKDTLRDAVTDAPVPESVLSRFMGGLDRATFEQLHALDHERLREGAEAILRGQGKLGELLLEASSGAVGLGARLEALREEADALHRPRARSTALHLAIEELRAAERAVATAALSPQAYRDQETRIAELRERVGTTEEQLRRARREREQLARLVPLVDPYHRLVRRRARRAELGAGPDVKEGAAKLRDEHARQRAAATEEAERAADEIARLSRARAALAPACDAVPAGLDEPALEALSKRDAAARAARVELSADLEALERRLREAEERLGPAPGPRPWSEIEIDDPRRVRLRAAIERRREGERDLARAARAVEEATLRHEALGEVRAQGPSPGPGPGLDAALAAAKRASSSAAARDDLANRLADREARLAALVALSGCADLAELTGAAPPPEELLVVEEQAEERARAEEAQLRRDLAAAAARARGATAALAALRAGGALPSEADLAASRERRGAHLSALAAALDRGDLAASSRALAEVREALRDSDALADLLRRESARVEGASQLSAELEAARTDELALGRELEALAAARSERAARLAASWPAMASRPLPTIRAFAARRAEALSCGAEITALEQRRAEITREVDAAVAALAAAGVAVRLPATAPQLEAAIAEGEALREAERARLQAEADRRAARSLSALAVAAAERDRARAAGELAGARAALDAELARVGLPGGPPVEEAALLVDALVELTRERARASSVRSRLERLDQEERAVREELAQLAEGSALAGLSLAETAARLAESARARVDLARIADALSVQREIERGARERARHADLELAKLAEAAGVPEAELAVAEERARERRALDREIAELSARLVDGLGAPDLASAEAELSKVDLDAVEDRLDQVSAEVKELDAQRDHLRHNAWAAERGLADLGGSGGAAELAENVEAQLALARRLARRAAVARAAVTLLEREVQRHREERVGPVLRRASHHFRALTAQRWDGLRVGERDDGELEIRCVRGAEAQPVGALSDGTADQLYLALRLAALEHHASLGDPLPVVLDDVLVHFDEERSAAALGALAEVARTTQVILFTHEQRVAELARAILPAERVVVSTLDRTP